MAAVGRPIDTTVKYWVYHNEHNEFHMDLTTNDVCEITGCQSGYVNVICARNIYLDNRFIVFSADAYASPSAFLNRVGEVLRVSGQGAE